MMKNQRGFTLLEIFIALAIGLVIIGGTLSVFVGLKTTTTETSSMGELQENGRFAVAILTEDLLRQNFWGDLNGTLSRDVLQLVPANAANDCEGEGLNNGSFPEGVGDFRALWGGPIINSTILNGCVTDAALNSDVLEIKRAIASPVAIGELEDNRYYIQSNVSSANIFAGNINTVPTLVESRIWEYQHHIYFIRESSIGTDGEVVPVLMQGRLQNNANPVSFNMLVEGIERIHFMFGVDTDDDGVVNAYMPSNEMQDTYWESSDNERILAVKMYVLVRSIRRDNNYSNDNVYQMGDMSFDANGDRYRRVLFSTTVALYNARIESW